MIKPAFIKKQLRRSRHDNRTAAFLRRLVFSVVDRTARRRYADAYCMKCFQCSAAIVALLERLGIRGGMVAGAFCVMEVFEDIRDYRWGGFWDRDHHVWAMTEFGELVDLSISLLHRHPASSRSDAIPMPPIWWTNSSIMPPIFRYLPDTVVHELADPTEKVDLREFKAEVFAELDRVLNVADVLDVTFEKTLDGMETLQVMTDSGHSWAQKSFAVQRLNIQFPPWIQERENELLEYWRRKQPAPSRLEKSNFFQIAEELKTI